VLLAKASDDGATVAVSIGAATSTRDVIECEGAVDDRTKLARIEQVREVGRELFVHILYQYIGASPTETSQLSKIEHHRAEPTSVIFSPKNWELCRWPRNHRG